MKSIGGYFIFLHLMLVDRESFRTYVRRTVDECVAVGVSSIFIVAVVSIFSGAVSSIQICYLKSPFAENFLVGYAVREITILETAPTVTALVFAGRVGSTMAGQLGSMRITEQIDALEIMGVNTPSYLVLPKILASILTYPLLVVIATFLAIYSGLLAAEFVASIASEDYIRGIRHNFDPYSVYFSLYKSLTYAFLIASISSYRGFYVSRGSLELGEATTRAVTESYLAVLVADYLLTQFLLHPPLKV